MNGHNPCEILRWRMNDICFRYLCHPEEGDHAKDLPRNSARCYMAVAIQPLQGQLMVDPFQIVLAATDNGRAIISGTS
jgi:hypothetical protein